MLYAAAYPPLGSSKKEEKLFGHELAYQLLYYGMEREYGKKRSSLRLEHGPHGKPFFSNSSVCFSLSHCAGLACCTFSDREIGVDVERVRPYDPKLAKRICTPSELGFLENAPNRGEALILLWTLKESLLKATGEGFHYGFQNAEFLFERGVIHPARKELRSISFQSVPGVFLSVCGFGKLPEKLELLEAKALFQSV